jgi:hypothetical protein
MDTDATIITSDSIRAGDNTATVNENGVAINGKDQGIYFDHPASHTTEANGSEVNHNLIDLAGSDALRSSMTLQSQRVHQPYRLVLSSLYGLPIGRGKRWAASPGHSIMPLADGRLTESIPCKPGSHLA